jgi:hypothetical protein
MIWSERERETERQRDRERERQRERERETTIQGKDDEHIFFVKKLFYE